MGSSTWTTLLLLSLLADVAHALPELALSKQRHVYGQHTRRIRRQNGDDTVETNAYSVLTWSQGGAYYANVTVGTPPQDQVVILDTGSSDLYFDSSTADTCQTKGTHDCRGGTFDHSKSSTYDIVAESPAFNTTFGDGSTAIGPFAEDIVGIGDVRIQGVQFGVADEVTSTTGPAIGLMGIGFSLIEATQYTYPNMPEVLKAAGEINSRLYSIYLNDIAETSGSILFGGIDTSKFTGPMTTINLLPSIGFNGVAQFITTVTALDVNIDGADTKVFSGGLNDVSAYSSSDNLALPVLLDTGSSAWSVPPDYYSAIVSQFPYVNREGLCPCSFRDTNDSLLVTFAESIQIRVAARNFIVPIYDPNTNEPVFGPTNDGGETQICAFMLTPQQSSGSSGFLTLGDAVLRSMYVVFDLDNGQVSLAQAALNITSTNTDSVVAVEAGPSGVADALSKASKSAIEPSQTQSYPIASEISGSETFTVSTAESTIGSATGTNAVPLDARPVESGTKGGSGTSGGGSESSSGVAAAGIRIPGIGMGEVRSFGSAVAGLGFLVCVGIALVL